jgi:hypothetical protein
MAFIDQSFSAGRGAVTNTGDNRRLLRNFPLL